MHKDYMCKLLLGLGVGEGEPPPPPPPPPPCDVCTVGNTARHNNAAMLIKHFDATGEWTILEVMVVSPSVPT